MEFNENSLCKHCQYKKTCPIIERLDRSLKNTAGDYKQLSGIMVKADAVITECGGYLRYNFRNV